jgi:REP element-mobilizing transposase RayT
MGRARENEPPMAEPLAYFLTWSTYGTWLPGDERGWIEYRHGWQLPDTVRQLEAAARMTEDACRLDGEQRDAVERQVAETCKFRGWELHAVNCRSNHAHVVVTANLDPKAVRNQLKAWSTRRLKELELQRRQSGIITPSRSVNGGRQKENIRENWWAERGSQRYINDLESLEAAILYVRDAQDKPREHQPEASAGGPVGRRLAYASGWTPDSRGTSLPKAIA